MMTLLNTAHQLMSPSKGILASDERVSSLNSKFATLSIPQTAEMRRKYREIFITTNGIENYLNGIILSEETAQQTTTSGLSFSEVLHHKGVLTGVKLDQGTTPLPKFPQESITLGLDELNFKLKFYKNLGASFTKWRAVFRIADGIPSDACLKANAQLLALFAAMTQEESMVPVIEPEVLMEGTHNSERCEQETLRTLQAVFTEIDRFRVDPSALILKTNMILPGSRNEEETSPEEVSQKTLGVLKTAVPDDVAGIAFLSGGQTTNEAALNLNAIAQYKDSPWPISFSFLRAIEQPALEIWRGEDQNIHSAQEVFLATLKEHVCAELGRYPDKCSS